MGDGIAAYGADRHRSEQVSRRRQVDDNAHHRITPPGQRVTECAGRSPGSRVLAAVAPSQPGGPVVCRDRPRRLQLRGQPRPRRAPNGTSPCSLLVPNADHAREPAHAIVGNGAGPVNRDRIAEIAPNGDGDVRITMADGAVIPGSRRYRDRLPAAGPRGRGPAGRRLEHPASERTQDALSF